VLHGRRILLIIAGGIAAYKSLDLIRRLRERGATVRCVMTEAAQKFITPLSAATLSGETVYTDLFSLTAEREMGHLRLAQESDLIVVAPATTDPHRQAGQRPRRRFGLRHPDRHRQADPARPSDEHPQWENQATQDNLATVEKRGIQRISPNSGRLAENESGMGRMAEPTEIAETIEKFFAGSALLGGRRALVTSGPTEEPIDPVRYIANRSSGKQGHAIAAALARLGAETTLVSGPTREPDPPGVRMVKVKTAREMLAACEALLPVDVAVCAAAVADWRAEAAPQKLKKTGAPPSLKLVENPDILATLAKPGNRRPKLVVGFAAGDREPDRQRPGQAQQEGRRLDHGQ
jgi:phosphopantothenoylcysteine decarboxylase/phosphopantothenate--cysteine ligase